MPSLHKIEFAYDTPNLNEGITVYTPAVGDVLLDAAFRVTVPWNAVEPGADISQSNVGLFAAWPSSRYSGAVNVGQSISSVTQPSYIDDGRSLGGRSVASNIDGAYYAYNSWHVFETTDPLLLWVSADGTKGGPPVVCDSPQGAAILYLLIAT